MSKHDTKDGLPEQQVANAETAAQATTAEGSAAAPSPDGGLDSALTDMALTLRQLVQTLRQSMVNDPRLDTCDERLDTLLKKMPNA